MKQLDERGGGYLMEFIGGIIHTGTVAATYLVASRRVATRERP